MKRTQRIRLVFALVASASSLMGCQRPIPNIPPGQDLPDASPSYVAACANLAAIGCVDGKYETCGPLLQRMDEQRLTQRPINLGCLTTAKTIAAARACGGVRCP